jgi:protocatechuate 3,4-dioxygenase beta subunit
MHRRFYVLLGALLTLPAGGALAQHEPVVGLPCEGCEAVFVGMPQDISSSARIAPEDEGGEPMVIEGRVVDASITPRAGIIIYAYHTDAGGIYPKDQRLRETAAYRHGYLRGWAKTDSAGRYRFETIRPGPYPASRAPAHVHMHVIEPGRCTYYIASIVFEDDPRLSDEDRERQELGRGGSGLVSPAREAGGRWVVRRDIVLGLRVPGYERCGE